MNKRILTIPNLLTLVRLLLVPLFVWLYVVRRDDALTAAVLAVSGLTDMLDGRIARRYGMVSDVGKLLDPIADKVTQGAMLICLVTRFPAMGLALTVLVVKEAVVGLTSVAAIRRTGRVRGAQMHGKIVTCVLYGVMLLHLVWGSIPPALSAALIAVCVCAMLLSLVLYVAENLALIRRGAVTAKGPLKVLMVVTVPMRYAGITLSLLRYVKHMPREGLRIDFLAINDVEPSLRGELSSLGSRLYVVDCRNRRPLKYIARVRRIVRENGYQIVHAHGNSTTLAVDLLAAKLGGAEIRCAHSRNTQTRFAAINALLRPAFDRLYTHAFACGKAAGEWLFRDRPFVILNNGTEIDKYRFDPAARAETRKRLGLGDRVAVGCVANFNRQKNHAFLIEAFEAAARANPNLALVLVGDGTLFDEIRETVRQKGLNDRVIFTGNTPDVPQLLSAMDVMALPSLYEGMPNVVIEWQVSGLPSLVADTVTRECRLTGLVRFLPLEASAWAEAMGEAAPDAAREATCAKAIASVRAAGFDIADNAWQLRRLYFEYAGMEDVAP